MFDLFTETMFSIDLYLFKLWLHVYSTVVPFYWLTKANVGTVGVCEHAITWACDMLLYTSYTKI